MREDYIVYKDDNKHGGKNKKTRPPASSILKRAFEAIDDGNKGYISHDDLGRLAILFRGYN